MLSIACLSVLVKSTFSNAKIMSNFTFNVFSMMLNWSILYEREETFRWRALKTLKVLASKCSLNSSTLKDVEEFSRLDVLSASFIH